MEGERRGRKNYGRRIKEELENKRVSVHERTREIQGLVGDGEKSEECTEMLKRKKDRDKKKKVHEGC